MSRPWLRPAVHAGMLGFAFLLPVLGPRGMALTAGIAALLNAFLLPRTAFGHALRREGEGRFGGLVTYPLAVSLAYLLFWRGYATLAWATMALGDPAAALVGSVHERWPRVPWNRRKTLIGSAAFLVAAWGGSLAVGFLLLVFGGGHDLDSLLLYAIATGPGALVGAVVESIPIPWDDNLPVVLAVAGFYAFFIPWAFGGL